MKVDYHNHTTFSRDGRSTMQAMCERALDLGLSEIAFTEHTEWVSGWGGFENLIPYWAEVQRLKPIYAKKGLRVLSGAEIGNPHWYPDEVDALLNEYPFDIVIGSVHWLYDEVNIHSSQLFNGRNVFEVYADYYSETKQMIEQAPVHFVAHFDRIFREGNHWGGNYNEERILPMLEPVWRALKTYNIGLELNTHYLDSTPTWAQNTGEMLKSYQQHGGEAVFINSDAHRDTDLFKNRTIAEKITLNAGLVIGEIHYQISGKWM